MKRAEYEQSLRTQGESLASRYIKETSRLDALLSDLEVRVNLYEDGGMFAYRILDAADRTVIEGLNPAYANPGDYRRIILALTEQALKTAA